MRKSILKRHTPSSFARRRSPRFLSRAALAIAAACAGPWLPACGAAVQHPEADAAYANGDFRTAADAYVADSRFAPLDRASAERLQNARVSVLAAAIQVSDYARRRSDFARAAYKIREALTRRQNKERPFTLRFHSNSGLESSNSATCAPVVADARRGYPNALK